MADADRPRPAGPHRFATTRWSVVIAAGGDESPVARAALDELFAGAWYPLYAFARRQGEDADAAQDAVQGFLTYLVEKNGVRVADPERGRFRTFLLTAFRNHLSNERDKERALKRGGGRTPVSLDAARAESRFGLEPTIDEPPERLFLRDWACAVLDRALADVRSAYSEKGRGELFDHLKPFLIGSATESYTSKAKALGMNDGALRVAVHRLRARYRSALVEQVSETLPDDADPDDEIRALFEALGP